MPTELRPAHLDDWLDTLPFANPGRCLELMHAALVETHAVDLKASVRLELLELYWLRYRFLLNSTVRAPANTTPITPAQRTQLLPLLREIALELGRGCSLALRGAGTPNRNLAATLFRVGQRQARTALLGLTAHAHALLLGFNAYAPAPEEIWRELHDLYSRGEGGMFLDEQLPDPDHSGGRSTTPRRAYSRLCACVLANPLQLEPGAIWQVYEMLADWNDDIELTAYQPPGDPQGVFVIKPRSASGPMVFRKIDPREPTREWQMLRCARLARRCQIELNRPAAQAGSAALDRNRSRIRLLEHLALQWGDTPLRRQPRRNAEGFVTVIIGLRDVHAMLETGGRPDLVASAATDSWQLINGGADGAALYATLRTSGLLRVGELLAVRLGADAPWSLTTMRWLLQEPSGRYKVGVQILCRSAQAVLLQAVSGSEFLTHPRPALLLDPAHADQKHSLLTSPGLYAPNLRLNLVRGAQRQEVVADRALERTVAFERFSYID